MGQYIAVIYEPRSLRAEYKSHLNTTQKSNFVVFQSSM